MRDRSDLVAESVADRPDVVAAPLARDATDTTGRCVVTCPRHVVAGRARRPIAEPVLVVAIQRAVR